MSQSWVVDNSANGNRDLHLFSRRDDATGSPVIVETHLYANDESGGCAVHFYDEPGEHTGVDNLDGATHRGSVARRDLYEQWAAAAFDHTPLGPPVAGIPIPDNVPPAAQGIIRQKDQQIAALQAQIAALQGQGGNPPGGKP
ncbi:MAG TPA: hypothetical protein VF054_06605 [Micromonosporaceae bacterium]